MTSHPLIGRTPSPAARIVTLGCPKNEADSEAFAGCLAAAGYRLVEAPGMADLLLVNTCAFIAPAVEESLDAMMDAIEWKGAARGRKLVLAGCLPGRYADDGSGGLEDFDLVIGPADTAGLLAFLSSDQRGLPVQVEQGVHRYLKIAEGCSNRCAYCTIPLIRGPMIPRSPADIFAEAEAMVSGNAAEIGLVAQDTGAWQCDGMNATGLLSELARRYPGIWWRLYYLHPAHIPDGLVELMENEPFIMPYLELPIQHAADTVLSRMGRHYRREDLESLFRRIEGAGRRIAVRTTVITGYPGETEADFQALLRFLERHPSIRTLCAFPYWPEEGTREFEATGIAGAAEPSLVQSRLAALGEVSDHLLEGWAGLLEGAGIDVLADSEEQGHSIWDAPGVDGACLFSEPCVPGTVMRCIVEECNGADMVVRPLSEGSGIGDGLRPCLSSGSNRPGGRDIETGTRDVTGRSSGDFPLEAPGQPIKNEPR